VAVGLDTSVVVRLLIGQPRAQMKAARRRIERAHAAGEADPVSALGAAETYKALRDNYGHPDAEGRSRLRDLAESGVVELDPPGAFAALENGKADLVDRLIQSRYRMLGAVTLTFDRRQGGLEGAVRL